MSKMKYTVADYVRVFRLMDLHTYITRDNLIKKVESEYGVRYLRNEMTHMLQRMKIASLIKTKMAVGYIRVAPEFTDLSSLVKPKRRRKNKKRGGNLPKTVEQQRSWTTLEVGTETPPEPFISDGASAPGTGAGKEGLWLEYYQYEQLLAASIELRLMKQQLKGKFFNPFR